MTAMEQFILKYSHISYIKKSNMTITPPTTTPCRHCRFDNVNKTKTVQRFDNFCKKLHGVG